ncbi:MAG: endonuclease/exonuclease/phosphatase family protein [Desulfococcaceae bacterium]
MTTPSANASSGVSVFTLNLRFGLAEDGPNGWQYRKKVFPSLFREYEADFMAFQEVNDFQLADLKALLPDHRYIGRRRPAPAFWQNNILFYRRGWRLIDSDYFFLSPTPDIPSRFRKSRWPRQCVLGRFRSENREIACGNTHFDFDADVQMRGARLILDRLSRLSRNCPTLLTGDFNASPAGPAHAVFTGGEAGRDSPEKAGFINTFEPEFPATHHGFTGSGTGDHIDWILYRGNLRPQSAHIVQDSIDGVYPSDHFPLRVVFEWESA